MTTDQVATPHHPRSHARGSATRNARARSHLGRLPHLPRLSSFEPPRHCKNSLTVYMPINKSHSSPPHPHPIAVSVAIKSP